MPDGTQNSMRTGHGGVPGIAMVPPAGVCGCGSTRNSIRARGLEQDVRLWKWCSNSVAIGPLIPGR